MPRSNRASRRTAVALKINAAANAVRQLFFTVGERATAKRLHNYRAATAKKSATIPFESGLTPNASEFDIVVFCSAKETPLLRADENSEAGRTRNVTDIGRTPLACVSGDVNR